VPPLFIQRFRWLPIAAALLLAGCGGRPATAHFAVSDMFCAECPPSIEETVRELPGVREVHVAYPQGMMVVRYDPRRIDPRAIARAVDERGYGARPLPEGR
jgi:copper chaperone CopZ